MTPTPDPLHQPQNTARSLTVAPDPDLQQDLFPEPSPVEQPAETIDLTDSPATTSPEHAADAIVNAPDTHQVELEEDPVEEEEEEEDDDDADDDNDEDDDAEPDEAHETDDGQDADDIDDDHDDEQPDDVQEDILDDQKRNPDVIDLEQSSDQDDEMPDDSSNSPDVDDDEQAKQSLVPRPEDEQPETIAVDAAEKQNIQAHVAGAILSANEPKASLSTAESPVKEKPTESAGKQTDVHEQDTSAPVPAKTSARTDPHVPSLFPAATNLQSSEPKLAKEPSGLSEMQPANRPDITTPATLPSTGDNSEAQTAVEPAQKQAQLEASDHTPRNADQDTMHDVAPASGPGTAQATASMAIVQTPVEEQGLQKVSGVDVDPKSSAVKDADDNMEHVAVEAQKSSEQKETADNTDAVMREQPTVPASIPSTSEQRVDEKSEDASIAKQSDSDIVLPEVTKKPDTVMEDLEQSEQQTTTPKEPFAIVQSPPETQPEKTQEPPPASNILPPSETPRTQSTRQEQNASLSIKGSEPEDKSIVEPDEAPVSTPIEPSQVAVPKSLEKEGQSETDPSKNQDVDMDDGNLDKPVDLESKSTEEKQVQEEQPAELSKENKPSPRNEMQTENQQLAAQTPVTNSAAIASDTMNIGIDKPELSTILSSKSIIPASTETPGSGNDKVPDVDVKMTTAELQPTTSPAKDVVSNVAEKKSADEIATEGKTKGAKSPLAETGSGMEISSGAATSTTPVNKAGLSTPSFAPKPAQQSSSNITPPLFGIGIQNLGKVVSFRTPPSFQSSALSPSAPPFIPSAERKSFSSPVVLSTSQAQEKSDNEMKQISDETLEPPKDENSKGKDASPMEAVLAKDVIVKPETTSNEPKVQLSAPKLKDTEDVVTPTPHDVIPPSEPLKPESKDHKVNDVPQEILITEIANVSVSARASDNKVRKREHPSTISVTTFDSGAVMRFYENSKGPKVMWSSFSSKDRIRIKKVTNRPFTMSVTKLGEGKQGKPIELDKYFLNLSQADFQPFYNSCMKYIHGPEGSQGKKSSPAPPRTSSLATTTDQPAMGSVRGASEAPAKPAGIRKTSKIAAEKKLLLEKMAALKKKKQARSSSRSNSTSTDPNDPKALSKDAKNPSSLGQDATLTPKELATANLNQAQAKNVSASSLPSSTVGVQGAKRPSSAVSGSIGTQKTKKAKSGTVTFALTPPPAKAAGTNEPGKSGGLREELGRGNLSLAQTSTAFKAQRGQESQQPGVNLKETVEGPGPKPTQVSSIKLETPGPSAIHGGVKKISGKADVEMKDSIQPASIDLQSSRGIAQKKETPMEASAQSAIHKKEGMGKADTEDVKPSAPDTDKAMQEARAQLQKAHRATEDARRHAQEAAKEVVEFRNKVEQAQNEKQEAISTLGKANEQISSLRGDLTKVQKELEEAVSQGQLSDTHLLELVNELKAAKRTTDALTAGEKPFSMNRCLPTSSEDFFARLRTFKPANWSGFLELGLIDPLECAMRGWYICEPNVLESTEGAKITLNLRDCYTGESYQKEIDRVRTLILGEGHKLLSGWVGKSCPEEFRTLEGSGDFYSAESLTSNLKMMKELNVVQRMKEGIDNDLYLPLDFSGDQYTTMTVYNWKVKKHNSECLLLSCKWCNRCVPLGAQPGSKADFHIRNSHYEFCPMRSTDSGVTHNVMTLKTSGE